MCAVLLGPCAKTGDWGKFWGRVVVAWTDESAGELAVGERDSSCGDGIDGIEPCGDVTLLSLVPATLSSRRADSAAWKCVWLWLWLWDWLWDKVTFILAGLGVRTKPSVSGFINFSSSFNRRPTASCSFSFLFSSSAASSSSSSESDDSGVTIRLGTFCVDWEIMDNIGSCASFCDGVRIRTSIGVCRLSEEVTPPVRFRLGSELLGRSVSSVFRVANELELVKVVLTSCRVLRSSS